MENDMNKSDGHQMRSGELYASFLWHTFMFLMLFCSNSAHCSEIQLVCDGPTNERTDGRTDRPTDGQTDGYTLL